MTPRNPQSISDIPLTVTTIGGNAATLHAIDAQALKIGILARHDLDTDEGS